MSSLNSGESLYRPFLMSECHPTHISSPSAHKAPSIRLEFPLNEEYYNRKCGGRFKTIPRTVVYTALSRGMNRLFVVFLLISLPYTRGATINTTRLAADIFTYCYANHKSPIPTKNGVHQLIKRSIEPMVRMVEKTEVPVVKGVGITKPMVSGNCSFALITLAMGIELDFEQYAPVICPMIESTGRPGPDLLKGNTIFKGSRATCESVKNYYINGTALNATLRLNRATINPNALKVPENGTIPSCYGPTSIDWEFCFFDVCSPTDIKLILEERAPKDVSKVVCDIVQYNPYKFEFTIKRIIFLSIIGVYLLLSLGVSVFTIVAFPPEATVEEVSDNSETFMRILVAFSIPFNLFKFFGSPSRTYDSTALNILATFSLIWLILGEASNLYTSYGRNPLDVRETLKTIGSQAKTQFRITFETFVFIIAAKIGLYYYKNVRNEEYNGGERPKPVLRSLALRASKGFVPFTLTYYLIIIVYLLIIREYLVTEMPLLYRTMNEEEGCREVWANFLFINNFFGSCLPNTFIIPLILQLVLFLTPLFILLSKLHKIAVFAVLGSLVVLSAVTRSLLVYFYDLPPTYIAGYDVVDREKFDFFKKYIYKLPWNYIAPFVVGLIYGCYKTSRVFKVFKNVRCPINLTPLIITPGILVLLAFSVNRFYNEFKLMSNPYRFLFSGLMPIVWAVTLLWFVLLFRSTNPLFKLFLNWAGWQRVAHITPIALALREIVYHLVAGYGLPMFEFFDSNQLTVLLGLPSLVIILLTSIILHVTFVMPLYQVHEAIFRRYLE